MTITFTRYGRTCERTGVNSPKIISVLKLKGSKMAGVWGTCSWKEKFVEWLGEKSWRKYIPPPFVALRPNADQGLLIHDVSRSHSDAPQSVGVLWTSDQPVTETCTWQHTTLTTDIHAPPWDSNPQSQQASSRRPTPQSTRPLGSALKEICRFENLKICR